MIKPFPARPKHSSHHNAGGFQRDSHERVTHRLQSSWQVNQHFIYRKSSRGSGVNRPLPFSVPAQGKSGSAQASEIRVPSSADSIEGNRLIWLEFWKLFVFQRQKYTPCSIRPSVSRTRSGPASMKSCSGVLPEKSGPSVESQRPLPSHYQILQQRAQQAAYTQHIEWQSPVLRDWVWTRAILAATRATRLESNCPQVPWTGVHRARVLAFLRRSSDGRPPRANRVGSSRPPLVLTRRDYFGRLEDLCWISSAIQLSIALFPLPTAPTYRCHQSPDITYRT